MKNALRIAQAELVLMMRARISLIGLVLLILLSGIAAASSSSLMGHERQVRDTQQAQTSAEFKNQPARHPHRVVHFGSYAHRPVSALAAFDPGVDPFTGTLLYLEGHRQNSAAFAAVRENAGLMRFGMLTPAFVLQCLAPLLLIFLGFSAVSREKEAGTFRQLRAHNVAPSQMVFGKFSALSLVAAAALLPALVALALAAAGSLSQAGAAALVGFGYGVYLLIWVGIIVSVSGLAKSSATSLVVLIGVWAALVVVAPRVSASLASQSIALPSRGETDLIIQAALRKLGDSHNPDDPFFADFKKRTLQAYGVTKVEDLPFNFRGAISAEGEKLTSGLFRDYATKSANTMRRQVGLIQPFAFLSPAIAVRRVSMANAGTDLENHLRFLEQAETHRYSMVQQLNRFHRDQLTFKDDSARSKDPQAERRTRITAANWAQIPDFTFVATTSHEKATTSLLALGIILIWLFAIGALLAFTAKRLELDPA